MDINLIMKKLNIIDVERGRIELSRYDLKKDKKNIPIEKITLNDFKGGVIGRDDIKRTKLIVFIDGRERFNLKG